MIIHTETWMQKKNPGSEKVLGCKCIYLLWPNVCKIHKKASTYLGVFEGCNKLILIKDSADNAGY